MSNSDTRIQDRDGEAVVKLRDLLFPLWQERKLFALVAIVTVALSIAAALHMAKYRSEGFFQFGGAIPIPNVTDRLETEAIRLERTKLEKVKEADWGIALSDFKRYSASIATGERFAEYIDEKKLNDSEAIQNLRRSIARNGVANIIEPVYPFTRADARLLSEQPRNSSNNVIGLRISYAGETAEQARQVVELLGNYAMDTIIYMTYSDTLRSWSDELASNLLKQENEIIENKVKLAEYRLRADELRQIIARNPATADQANRQVVAVDERSARYLPLSTQLATTEVMAADANEKIRQIQREQQQDQLYLDYFSRARALLQDTRSGEAVLHALEGIRDAVFEGKNMEDDVIKETHNRITVNIRTAQNTYLERSRFIAGPTLPQKSTMRLSVVLIFSLLGGLGLAFLFILVRKWIRQNMADSVNSASPPVNLP